MKRENHDAAAIGVIGDPGGRRRIHLMDELRGFAVLCMVFYHAFYTLAVLFDLGWSRALLLFFMPAEPFLAALFIFISGISSDLSHSNLRRGLKLAAVALGVTLVTALFVPDEAIWFGILHFLSVCMILYGLLKPKMDKIPFSWAWPALSAALFFFTRNIARGYLGFGDFRMLALPQALYGTNWLFPLGIYAKGFTSSDYFPLLPWIFVFCAGTFLGRFAAAGVLPEPFYRSRVPFLSWMGRHALVIYIAHQPLIYGAAMLIKAIAS